MNIITFFGSAKAQPADERYRQARELGRHVAAEGWTVCNGGYGGIMEASSRGAREAGGRTIGVVARELGVQTNSFTDQTILMEKASQRLIKLAGLGDAYVVLDGGTGTLLEFVFVWEQINKGLMPRKPLIFATNRWRSVVTTLTADLNPDATSFMAWPEGAVMGAEECIRALKAQKSTMRT